MCVSVGCAGQELSGWLWGVLDSEFGGVSGVGLTVS